MSFSQPYLIAPVVYEYVWKVDDSSRQTSTYTTTYSGPPGSHTAYALVVNTALPSPLQHETIGIPYTILPGGVSTQHASATVATQGPTPTNDALVTPVIASSVLTSTPPKVSCHKSSPGRVLSLYGSYLTCLQIVLVCLFCSGYLWSRYLRRRNRSHKLEGGSALSNFEKSAIYELA